MIIVGGSWGVSMDRSSDMTAPAILTIAEIG